MPLSDFKSALVTGASSGIGRAVVKELTNANITTSALARRHDLLQTLQDETGCIHIALDLRDRSEIDAKLTGLEVDILINNAGHGRSEGLFIQLTQKQYMTWSKPMFLHRSTLFAP